jgi:hypothetical protein
VGFKEKDVISRMGKMADVAVIEDEIFDLTGVAIEGTSRARDLWVDSAVIISLELAGVRRTGRWKLQKLRGEKSNYLDLAGTEELYLSSREV